MAKGIKNELYTNESQQQDLQAFKDELEECLAGIEDPRSQDKQTIPLAV